MHRLRGFDYKRPFFYMVTMKRLANLAAFSQISDDAEPPKDAKGRPRYLVANEITRAFARVIRHFHEKWWGALANRLLRDNARSYSLACSHQG